MRPDLRPQTAIEAIGWLTEECGEVISELGHIDRFGYQAVDRLTNKTYDNLAALLSELDDLEAAIACARYFLKQVEPLVKTIAHGGEMPAVVSGTYYEENVRIFNKKDNDWEPKKPGDDPGYWARQDGYGCIQNPKSSWWRIVMSKWNGET